MAVELNERLLAMISDFVRDCKQDRVKFPKYDYATPFNEWALHFASICNKELALKEPEMVQLAVKKLEGYAELVASFWANQDDCKQNWSMFVRKVNSMITVNEHTKASQALTIRQEEVQDQDLYLYASTKSDNFQRYYPGCECYECYECYDELGQPEFDGTVTTLSGFFNREREVWPRIKATLGNVLVADRTAAFEEKNERAYVTINILNSEARIGKTLEQNEQEELIELIIESQSIFAFSVNERDLGRTHIIEHIIDTGNNPPVKQKPYNVEMTLEVEIKKQIDLMLKMGIISPSRSPYASPVVVVPKKDDTVRMCIDYRQLNEITKKDSFPMFPLESVLGSIKRAKYFTALDIKSGYHQIPIRQQDREKTAFILSDGLYEYNVMPFGLCNAPATFQRMMNHILRPVLKNRTVVYLDDILVYSYTFEEHLVELAKTIILLKKAGLKINLKKCMFGLKEITFLGYKITEDGMMPDPENIRAIIQMPAPNCLKEAKSVHGMFNFYLKFIQDFAQIAAPITYLFQKYYKFEWGQDQQEAFDTLKKHLTSFPTLALFDRTKETEVRTDASGKGLGAVLAQKHDDHWRPVLFASRKLRGPEFNYAITDLEAAAIMYAINKFEQYLLSIPFTIVTDHQSLQFLKLKKLSPKLTRWAIRLQEFDFTVIYRSGKLNRDADALSRLPVAPNVEDPYFEEKEGPIEFTKENREFCFMIQPLKEDTTFN